MTPGRDDARHRMTATSARPSGAGNPDGRAERGRPGPLLWIAAAATVLVFLGRDAHRLSAPFGPSHDGFNAALFMTGGRAIVEEGPIESRLGASSRTLFGDRVVYAHHPPLIYLASALAFTLPGPVEARARLPAVVSGLAVLFFTVILLHHSGLGPGAAAVGLLFAFGTPMFFVFGAMTEPDVLGLAPMTGLTLLWQRSRRGVDAPLWALGSAAAAGTLTSWQASLFSALVGTALLLERRRSAAAAVLLGTAVGAVLTGLWMLWAYQGDVREFIDRARLRAGAGDSDRVSILQAARQQLRYLRDLFPVGSWLVVAVAGLGLLDRRTRPLVAVSLGTVLGYAVVFKNGAYDHSYWLYCLLLPLPLGAAVAADAVSRWLARHRLPRLAPAAFAAPLVVALALTVWRPSNDQGQNRIGAALGAQARAIDWPGGQRYAYHTFGGDGYTDLLPWLRFYARREPFGIDGPASVPQGQVVLRLVDGRLRADPGERQP